MKTEEIADTDPSQKEVEILRSTVDRLVSENSVLKEQLAWLTRQVFGKKSEVLTPLPEKHPTFPEMSAFFAEAPVEPEKENSSEPKKNKAPKRNGQDAIKIPENLPVKTIVLDIPEEEKTCKETGVSLIKIGEEVSLKLAYTPGSYFIKKLVRLKYAHPQKEENGVLCPELPTTIFPKCKADDSLLAEILVKKYCDHLPLYRISEILARDGIGINRKSLSQWAVRCGKELTPLYDEMVKRVLSSNNIFTDETPINVQSIGSVEKGFMWVIVGGIGPNPPYRIYDFRKDRSHGNLFKILGSYKGILHSDKYGAYVAMAKKEAIIWCPCWTHIRRYFFEVESGDPKFRMWVLRKIRYLYMFEKIARAKSPEERLEIRQKKEVPIIDELIKKIQERASKGDLLPKCNLHKAIHYFLGLIPYMKNYTNHPDAHIDNNVAERAVRPLAIGRKNWLFFGSLDAGQSSAIVFSLIQTCRGLNINPQEYLEDIFRRLADHPANKLYELLPDQWLLSRKQP